MLHFILEVNSGGVLTGMLKVNLIRNLMIKHYRGRYKVEAFLALYLTFFRCPLYLIRTTLKYKIARKHAYFDWENKN